MVAAVFEETGASRCFSDSFDCYHDEDDSLYDEMANFIQKLLAQNKTLKQEIKTLKAIHGSSRIYGVKSFRAPRNGDNDKIMKLADGGLSRQRRSYSQVVSEAKPMVENERNAFCFGSERNPNEKLKKNVEACQFCGKIHRWGRKRCSAYGHRCSNCWKENHFEEVCFYRQRTKRHIVLNKIATERQTVLKDGAPSDKKSTWSHCI